MILSERLLEAKAKAAREYKTRLGTMQDFPMFWAEAEPDVLALLDEQLEREQAVTAGIADLGDDEKKAAFIKARGLPAYRELLHRQRAGV